MPITNIQIAQGSISRVQSTTNYEGDGVDLGDGDGDGDGADVDGDEDASSHASEQQDLPSPGVGDDFRRCRLDKSWEKYGVTFLRYVASQIKVGPR